MKFGREKRLRLRSEFARVKLNGRDRNAGPIIISSLRREPPTGSARLGLIVSRRVGNAVTRNLVKRRLRAIFCQQADNLDPACDYVIIARKKAASVDFSEMKERFARATIDQPKI